MLVLEGGISVPVVKSNEDIEMTDESFDDICKLEIKSILDSRKGWRLIESDFSSVAL
jgi:hypothetical protein